MSRVKLNLIAAACENGGIGINGNLPWRLRKEMAFFTSMTTLSSDESKKNAIIMGRRTWDCIPPKYRPLVNRVNVVLSRSKEEVRQRVPEGVVVCGDLEEAVKLIGERQDLDSHVWVIGGSSVYKDSMAHPNCHRVYLTEIKKSFDCDTFFPTIPEDFKLLKDHGDHKDLVPEEKQQEGDIEYYFRIYEKDSMAHPNCHRVYLTEIKKSFDCDTFFPTIPEDFKLLKDHGDHKDLVPEEKQQEGDIEYYFRIYEKV